MGTLLPLIGYATPAALAGAIAALLQARRTGEGPRWGTFWFAALLALGLQLYRRYSGNYWLLGAALVAWLVIDWLVRRVRRRRRTA